MGMTIDLEDGASLRSMITDAFGRVLMEDRMQRTIQIAALGNGAYFQFAIDREGNVLRRVNSLDLHCIVRPSMTGGFSCSSILLS